MIQSLRNEATKSEDISAQLQEVQESVRLAFLNCLLFFTGMVDLVKLNSGTAEYIILSTLDNFVEFVRSFGAHWQRA